VIRAVVFDVGECLVNETREYGTWADWLGVPRHTFSAVFGSVIARGLDYQETFQVFRPGFDLTAEREARAKAGQPEWFGEEDLYPDVRPTLAALRGAGCWLGIAGNQTSRASGLLGDLFADDVDLIATSDDWGASKPDTEFFSRLAEAIPFLVHETLYVGDRLDNDILPAIKWATRQRCSSAGHGRPSSSTTRQSGKARSVSTRSPNCPTRSIDSTLQGADRTAQGPGREPRKSPRRFAPRGLSPARARREPIACNRRA
jgi:HAD superfamily hydrolase (TIGR01549 family)